MSNLVPDVLSGMQIAQALPDDVVGEFARDGSILTIALGLGWFLLRRSDSRETSIREALRKELQDEREAHEETREKWIQAVLENKKQED